MVELEKLQRFKCICFWNFFFFSGYCYSIINLFYPPLSTHKEIPKCYNLLKCTHCLTNKYFIRKKAKIYSTWKDLKFIRTMFNKQTFYKAEFCLQRKIFSVLFSNTLDKFIMQTRILQTLIKLSP